MTDTTLTGKNPIDPSTAVGLTRIEIGDVVGTVHEDDATKAEYEFFGDAGLQALLDANPGEPEIAIGKALNSAAFQLLAAAEDIQVDDIRIKTVERAGMMRQLASDYLSGTLTVGANSAFQVVALRTYAGIHRPPQGTPYPIGF